jgi:hypothetical protein
VSVTEPEDFNLMDVIRDIMNTTQHLGPDAIATEVAHRIPEDRKEQIFRDALRTHVHSLMNRARSTATGKLPPLPNRSAKGDAIRAWAVEQRNKRLTEQIHVGAGEWKLLADCTADNLRFAAHERITRAHFLIGKADAFDTLANVLDEMGAKTVRELPETIVNGALGDDE